MSKSWLSNILDHPSVKHLATAVLAALVEALTAPPLAPAPKPRRRAR